jgi:hypothetical protein
MRGVGQDIPKMVRPSEKALAQPPAQPPEANLGASKAQGPMFDYRGKNLRSPLGEFLYCRRNLCTVGSNSEQWKEILYCRNNSLSREGISLF